MRRILRTFSLLVVLALVASGPAPVWAGEGDDPGAAAADEDGEEEGEQEGEEEAEPAGEDWQKKVWAEEDVAAPDAVQVVITAERSQQAQSDAAASVSAVGGERMDQMAPTDVTAVIQTVPGVDVQRMGPAGYGANVSIRGSSDFKPGGFGNRVLVLLDGRPINAPDTHGVDWSALPLFDIGRVEVLRGPASALYGSTAVGGVVQLFTRPYRPGADFMLGQGFAFGDPNRTSMAGSMAQAGEGWGIRLSGWLQDYAGLKPPNEDAFRHNSDSRRSGARLSGEAELAAHHRLSAEAGWMSSSGGNPGFEGTSLYSRSRRFDRTTFGSRLGWRYDPAGSLDVQTDVFWNRFQSRVDDPDGSNPNTYDTDRAGLRSAASFLLWDRAFNTVGLETEVHHVVGDVYELGSGTYQLFAGAAFLQSAVDLGAGFEATGGLRFDGFVYSSNQRFFSLSPKLRLAWRPDEQTVVWLSANRGFRAPSIGELYLRYEASFGLTFQGNPELRPEVLWAFEAGARRTFFAGKLRAELVAFWNEGFDTIEFDYRGLPVSAANLDGSRIVGLEGALLFAPSRWFALDGNASWMRAENLEDGSALLYRPAIKGSLGLIFRMPQFDFTARLMGVGSRSYDDFIGAELLDIPRRKLGGYAVVDLSARWLSPWGVILMAQVKNLFDADYHVIQNYPPPGREYYLEARLKLD